MRLLKAVILGLGASILAPGRAPRGTILAPQPGGPWKKQERHEGVWNWSCIDVGSTLGNNFQVFWAPRHELSISFRVSLQVTFCIEFGIEIWTPGLLKTGLRMVSIAQANCLEKSFFLDFGLDLGRFPDALGMFF